MSITLSQSTMKVDDTEQHRLDSFKLGWGVPLSNAGRSSQPSRHSHFRSHSRNTSISSIFSLSSPAMPSTPDDTVSHISSNFKRNSHHRRRSSVSTRHESAEIMGVFLPESSSSSCNDDNTSLSEKDSIRKRALWALEGKSDASFAKVEIPELTTSEVDKHMFDFPTKPSFPPGSGLGFGNGKRDSFKLLGNGSSAKDQLHTLLEEEEEEEEEEANIDGEYDIHTTPVAPPTTPITPSIPVAKSKPRPATLSLRPLSLTPDNLISTYGLPTPSLTPSSTRSGLRQLSLANSTTSSHSNEANDKTMKSSLIHSRPALHISTPMDNTLSQIVACDSPDELQSRQPKRSSISYRSSGSLNGLATPEMTPTASRRYSGATSHSSVSSFSDLTKDDDASPTSPQSNGFISRQSRPLSVSEQHFLFKSHNTLLSRIQDLEKALSVRRRESFGYGGSRPVSMSSDVSSNLSEPNDEMLRLVTDLKAERDELKRDVDGWRVRVADLEKQIGVFVNRVEGERREAWVARSKVGVIEAEKSLLEKSLENKVQEIEDLRRTLKRMEAENRRVVEENERLILLSTQLQEEKKDVEEELQRWMDRNDIIHDTGILEDGSQLATPTPTSFEARFVSGKKSLGFSSLDSEATAAADIEFESYNDDQHFSFGFKSVHNQDQYFNENCEEEDDNGLAGYEDEDDDDLNCQSPISSSSSFGSELDLPRSVDHLTAAALDTTNSRPSLSLSPSEVQQSMPVAQHISRGSLSKTFAWPKQNVSHPHTQLLPSRSSHSSHGSLSKTWAWPSPTANQLRASESDIDNFFGCLEDNSDNASEHSVPSSPSNFSFERSKGIFASGFSYEDDTDMPFLSNYVPGIVVDDSASGPFLGVLTEEDEDEEENESETTQVDDEDMFGDIGGIKITFTPPEEDMKPFQTTDHDESDNLDDSVTEDSTACESDASQSSPSPGTLMFKVEDEDEDKFFSNFGRPIKVSTPPEMSPLITPPPSNPRPVVAPSGIPRVSTKMISLRNSNIYSTPPPKRPSFIPQPISSSPTRIPVAPSKPKAPSPTFVRQFARKPGYATRLPNPAKVSNEDETISTYRSSSQLSHSLMKSVDISKSVPASPSSSSSSTSLSYITSPITSRLSLQSLTSFMPVSWSPRSASKAPSVDVGHDVFGSPTPAMLNKIITPAFVSRDAQLAKLKAQIEHDQTCQLTPTKVDICKKCNRDEVRL